MQKYRITKTLGDGSFGTVFKAINLHDNEIVAIKKMKQKYHNWEQCMQLRQIKSLKKLTHPNLIKLKEVLKISDELYLVFDFLQYNLYQVYNHMKQKGRRLTENEIKSIMYQIVSGLAHLHKSGFFHRDMKPQNILFDNNIVKICDFGLARQIRSRPPFTEYVSTRYRAPQLLLHSSNYNSPVDIFALGCIMVELYTFNPLFPGNNQIDQMNKIVDVLGTPSKNDWPQGFKLATACNYNFQDKKKQEIYDIIPDASSQAVELIEQMLQYSSRKRPSAFDVLKHAFFSKINLPNEIGQQKQTRFQNLENMDNKSIFVFPNQMKVENPKQIEMRKSQLRFGQPKDAKKKTEQQPKRIVPSMSNISQKFDQIQSLIQQLSKKQQKKQSKYEFQSKLPLIKEKLVKQQQQAQNKKFPPILTHKGSFSNFPISINSLRQSDKYRQTPKFESKMDYSRY